MPVCSIPRTFRPVPKSGRPSTLPRLSSRCADVPMAAGCHLSAARCLCKERHFTCFQRVFCTHYFETAVLN